MATDKRRRIKLDSTKESKRRIRFKNPTQFCIDTDDPWELLRELPQEVEVLRMSVKTGRVFSASKREKVPTKLRRLGVQYFRTVAPTQEASMTIEGAPRDVMLRNIEKVNETIKTEAISTKVESVLLQYKGIRANFQRTAKEIRPDETDQRKKLFVLGITSSNQEDESAIAPLIRAISATKYTCEIQVVPVRTVICSRVE